MRRRFVTSFFSRPCVLNKNATVHIDRQKMQVSQLQVATDNVQDRLVLRVATKVNEEYRIFFTRRFLRELWPYLTTMLAGHLGQRPALSPQPDAPSNAATTFEQPFRDDNPNYPLGSSPLLISQATLEPAGEGLARLTLREGRERSFELSLSADMLQALCAMLRAASEQAQWEITLDYQGTNEPKAINHTSGKPLLH